MGASCLAPCQTVQARSARAYICPGTEAPASCHHPYLSTSGSIAAAVNQFRKAFPATVNAETLKKLSIAPNNESYLINILRFIGAIDEAGNRTEKAQSAFSKHDDAEFQKALEALIKSA